MMKVANLVNKEIGVKKNIKKPKGLLETEMAGVNQILPIYYPWAWESYEKGVANNWVPTEISMQKDIQHWKDDKFLTPDEKLVIKRCLGFFAGSESLVANNLLLSIHRWVTNPECRQYLLRQAYEEALHNHTIVYICDSLNLNISEVYEAFHNIPSIKDKNDFLMNITTDINRPDFNTSTVKGKQELLRNLITYYVICEGIMFYSGFAMLLSFGRQNKMPGVAEQIQYTLRDESLHIKFGINLINTLKKEYENIWPKKLDEEIIEHIKKAVELEIAYANDVLPTGILGLNAEMFVDYVKYVANRRLNALNLDYKFVTAGNPFPWMSEIIDLEKQKNFFETRVTSYTTGTLLDDL